MRHHRVSSLVLILALAAGCGESSEPTTPTSTPAATEPPAAAAPAAPDRATVREQARAIFGSLPTEASSKANPVTEAKITLGRMLYYEPRLSLNHDVSCNSCHGLSTFGVDGEPTSPGHKGQRGDRNSPTVYNAAFHIAQFWDGRAADVEEQAKGPVLNPVEMAMPSEEAVVEVLRSIPGYAPLFAAAFPGEDAPVTYDNMARAIGAFERRLVTPAPFDAFLAGDDAAVNDAQVAGLALFIETGCITCHNGAAIGGGMYQKLGLVKPFPSEDPGRFKHTGKEPDRGVFKVPSLRNVTETGPYLHDGSIRSLDLAIHVMAQHQLGRSLDEDQVASIHAFLGSLEGEADTAYIAKPELPESGPDTPAPDPG